MSRTAFCLALALLGLTQVGVALAGVTQDASSLHLVKVVMVSRHGVRSGTQSTASLARYTTRPWPVWPVAPGELTPHGAHATSQMGQWLRQHYVLAGLLPATGCAAPGTVMVWADNADQRTRVSGQAMLDGLFPGCGLHAYWRPSERDDPLFHGSASGPMDSATAMAAIHASGNLKAPGPAYQAALARLRTILGDAPPCTGKSTCDWIDAPNRLVSKPDGDVSLKGPLHDGATLAETLLLEYTQGMPLESIGTDAAGIAAIMPLHTAYSQLMRRTPYLAAQHSGLLLQKILGALESSTPAHTNNPADAKALLLFLGHDTNLANLGGLLHVDWTLDAEPDPTAPDTTLAFELLHDNAGHAYVRLRLYYQTLEQLRLAQRLDAMHPAGSVDLAVPACADVARDQVCPLPRFSRIVAHALTVH